MRLAGDRMRDDFDREITRVYSTFQPSGDDGQPLRDGYAASYAQWQRTSPYPKLVSDLFLIDGTAPEPARLERFNPSSLRFETAEWPPELNMLRNSHTMTSFRGRAGALHQGVQQVFIFDRTIQSKIPAVIIPVLKPTIVPGMLELPKPVAQIVVKLDLDYIQKEFIPGMAKALDYNLTVVDTMEPRRVIYSSAGATDEGKGDFRTGIFSARPLDYKAVFAPMGAITASRDIIERRIDGKFAVRITQSATTAPFTAGAFINAEAAGGWQLILTHRAGSLDAAVAQTRQRNLVISFTILLLLTLSVGLILISAQRERRLARQQLEFVSTVSHELRTPLAVICSASENLADGVVRSEEQTRQYGSLIRSEGRRLAEMVEQVLDFAGIQSGRKAYRLEPTDVSDVIDRALEIFEMQIRDSGVVLEKGLASELPQILADRPALIRALQNLISNALKYGDGGKWISLRADLSGDKVNIVVADRGQGISAVDLPHIFEPFYRGRSVVEAQIQGSGLGLALVKQIVDAHGAKISVESTPSAGCSFIISIPVAGAVSNFVGSHDQAYSPR
jgi:two-component system phosphate regulon sensor histidine kinase PhoR